MVSTYKYRHPTLIFNTPDNPTPHKARSLNTLTPALPTILKTIKNIAAYLGPSERVLTARESLTTNRLDLDSSPNLREVGSQISATQRNMKLHLLPSQNLRTMRGRQFESMLLTELVENCESIQKEEKREEPVPRKQEGCQKGDQHIPRIR